MVGCGLRQGVGEQEGKFGGGYVPARWSAPRRGTVATAVVHHAGDAEGLGAEIDLLPGATQGVIVQIGCLAP